jgi:hypothetical protein
MLGSASNPAELARAYSQRFDVQQDDLLKIVSDGFELAELAREADSRGYFDKDYVILSTFSTVLPKARQLETTRPVVNFDQGLEFQGRFIDYASMRNAKALGTTALDKVYLQFDHITLLPDGDIFPEGYLLYTPVTAVHAISLPQG